MTEREAIKRALELLPQMRDSQWVTVVGQVTAIYTDEAKEAFNIAITALEKQEQDRWIPCKERLPEEPDEVLVTDGDGEIRHAVYCHVCKKDVFITYEESMTIHQVIAWKPLPEPYTEEEE